MTRNFANQVRSGLSLEQALQATAAVLPPPLGTLLKRADYQVNNSGATLREALLDLKREVQIDGLTVFVIAVLIAKDKGGELPEKLDRIAFSLEELQRVERKKESDTAAGRLVVTLLACFPFGFISMFYFLDPEGTTLVFSLTSGQIILSAVGLIVYVSVRWAQSILNKVE
jgi:Flp pilus assembly protein TadB